jgi:tRNA uracil 4-sulfurtransferase
MKSLFLIRLGELTLKGKNRHIFERTLRQNIKMRLRGIPSNLENRFGRFYLSVDSNHREITEKALKKTSGIAGFAEASRCKKDIEDIKKTAVQICEKLKSDPASFKVETRRSDKSFKLTSYEISHIVGDIVRTSFPHLTVDVHNPDLVLNVEIRENAYLYMLAQKGQRGLPIGIAGRALLLLSGGIDSPVAGYLMAKRGLIVDSVYFHTHPYTSEDAKEKVKTLSRILSEWVIETRLHVVPFTDAVLRINESAPEDTTTLMMRAAMMDIADRIAGMKKLECIITGESLSQVASQTTRSLRFSGSKTTIPIFRPLIGIDKEQIITIAKEIGTFETSIQPFDDCCTLFTPKHPLLYPEFAEMTEIFRGLDMDGLMQDAAEKIETFRYQLGKEK